MATRSNIGILERDGTVTWIYCHWDGYPSHHGPILLDHYDTARKVRKLLALGDLSVLGAFVGSKHDFGDRSDGDDCTAYHRDRGEPWGRVGPKEVGSEEEFAKGAAWGEYVYLWKRGAWHFCDRRAELKPLTREDCSEVA
jgi:hypothetical protein